MTTDASANIKVTGYRPGAIGRIAEPHATFYSAHSRWFILTPACQDVGRHLLAGAPEFCRDRGFPLVFLWTFAGLETARYLYENSGFRLAEEVEIDQRGGIMQEQRFVLGSVGD